MILGIDPGKVTGWTLYNEAERRVVACGHFPRHQFSTEAWDHVLWSADGKIPVVFESLEQPRGGIYPAVVLAAIDEGRMREQVLASTGIEPHVISRHDVKRTLSLAVHNEPLVRDDKTTWQALVALHGPGSDQKRTKDKQEGCIGLVTGHERAALAVAVAWAIRNRLAFVGGTA